MQPIYKNKGILSPFRIQLFLDIVILLFSFELAYYTILGHFPTLIERDPYSLLFLYIIFLWIILVLALPVYIPQRIYSLTKTTLHFIKYASYYIGLLTISIVIFQWHFVSREILSLFLLFFMLFGILSRAGIRIYNFIIRAKGKEIKHVIIAGTGQLSAIIENKILERKEFGYDITGFLLNGTADLAIKNRHKIIGNIKDINTILDNHVVDEVVIALGYDDYESTKRIIKICDQRAIRAWIIPDFFAKTGTNAILDDFDGVPILRLREEPLQFFANRFIKRSFDILLSSLVLITIFPMIATAVYVANFFGSKGPLFYRQKRNGFHNEVFSCYKFRSMKVAENGDDVFVQATKNDPRITPIGKWLRKTNLDELPQIINVLKGEMSIVGPRPHPIELNNHWHELIQQFMVRHLVRPGLTGWAQVNGYRGETETYEKMAKRIDFDIWYIENWTFSLDIRIILKTAYKMIVGDKQAY